MPSSRNFLWRSVDSLIRQKLLRRSEVVQFCRSLPLLQVSERQRPKALLTAANGPFLFFSLTETSVVGSRYRRGPKGCGGTVAIPWPVPGTPTYRPSPRPRPHALVNLLPTSSRRGAHLFCASLARVSSVPPTLCRTVSPTFGSKFIPCGTALLSARLRILVPCYLEATPAPLLFGSHACSHASPQPRPIRMASSRRVPDFQGTRLLGPAYVVSHCLSYLRFHVHPLRHCTPLCVPPHPSPLLL